MRRSLAALTLTLALGACAHDADTPLPDAPSTPPGKLQLDAVAPAGDTIWQRGVELAVRMRDRSRIYQLTATVDAGTAAEQSVPWSYDRWTSAGVDSVRLVAFVAAPGPHRFTVAVVTAAGDSASATLVRTFALATRLYTATPLPDLGGAAMPLGVDDAGDVAGWAAPPAGHARAAVWRRGALSILDTPDTVDAAASRVNAAGDVLYTLGPLVRYGPHTPMVRRADGASFQLGPLAYQYGTFTVNTCCQMAGDLTEDRIAIATSNDLFFPTSDDRYVSVVFDVAAGKVVDSSAALLLARNARGQTVGQRIGGYSNVGRYLVTPGVTTPAPPSAAPRTVCDRPGRFSQTDPIDLADDGTVLALWCGNAMLMPAGAPSLWIDRVFGATAALHMSHADKTVVALADAGALFVWRPGERGPTQIRTADGWRFDGLGGVNASGVIAAHGTRATDGRGAVVLLTPSR